MLKFHLRTSFALLLLGFILGFCTSTLLYGCKKSPVFNQQPTIAPKQLKNEATVIEQSYQRTIAELQYQNHELQQDLESTQDLLNQSKQTTRLKEAAIRKIIEPAGFMARDLLPRFDPPRFNTKVSACDSLVIEVASYIQENHRKDSIYEVQLIQMDSMMTIKDALVSTNENAYINLQHLFNQSISGQETLAKENLQLRKKYKRQRFKSRILTVGGVIITGVAANFLLKR